MIAEAHVDPVHFGLIVTVNLAIGMFLPPFGLNLFASNTLFGAAAGSLSALSSSVFATVRCSFF